MRSSISSMNVLRSLTSTFIHGIEIDARLRYVIQINTLRAPNLLNVEAKPPHSVVKHLPETIKRQEWLLIKIRILEYLMKFLETDQHHFSFDQKFINFYSREEESIWQKEKEKGDPQFAAKIKGIHRVKNNYHDNDQGLYGFTKRKEMEGSVLRCALSFIRVASQISTVSQCLFIKATPAAISPPRGGAHERHHRRMKFSFEANSLGQASKDQLKVFSFKRRYLNIDRGLWTIIVGSWNGRILSRLENYYCYLTPEW